MLFHYYSIVLMDYSYLIYLLGTLVCSSMCYHHWGLSYLSSSLCFSYSIYCILSTESKMVDPAASVWKSSHKTEKQLWLNWTRTGKDPKFSPQRMGEFFLILNSILLTIDVIVMTWHVTLCSTSIITCPLHHSPAPLSPLKWQPTE
jgi:hypothetical protein